MATSPSPAPLSRFVWRLFLLLTLSLGAFFAGYRWGFFDGYAHYVTTFNGVRVRMVPIDEAPP